MDRRRFIKTATVGATLLPSVGSGVVRTPPRSSGHDQYFSELQRALRKAGFYRPTMVIDRDRLLANIDTLNGHLKPGMGYRAVTKSLPSYGLIDTVMKRANTQRLMVFHQPFLNAAFNYWPKCEALLGKPMPVGAAARFYQLVEDPRAASARVQWLIDSTERLVQYHELAAALDLQLRVNLEIDVGFHRGGFSDPSSIIETLRLIQSSEKLSFSGFMGYDGHVSIFPQYVGEPQQSIAKTNNLFNEFIRTAKSVLGDDWVNDGLTLNTSGSTTYQLYSDGGFTTPANEVAIGSGLVKPTFCDKALPNHFPAAFIATPILKKIAGVRVPGLESNPRGGAEDDIERADTYFVYGGKWMAKVASPQGLAYHPIYGRSSNQDMFTGTSGINLGVDDLVFYRPTQSEAVLTHFGDIAVYEKGAIVDTWSTLKSI